MFDFDLDLDLGSRRQPQEWAVAVHDSETPHKPPKRRTQRERKQSKRERRAAAAAAAGTQQAPVQLTPAQAKYRKEFRDPSVVCLSTEIENGNVEYKYNLTGCATNPNRQHQLTTQMKFRLSEGGGECFYYVGVEDDGYPRGLEPPELLASTKLLQSMAASLSATARLVEYVPGGFGANAALLHIKANAEEDMRATDLRVAVAGSMDAGKSTLVAVLTQGSDGRPLLDNSRGAARMAVFRHKHEIETGRTSSISHQVLGYDQEGRVLNYVGVAVPTPADITAAAHQLVQFIDMGGHEKYLKTTLYGMTCMLPDYVLLCVDAVCGVTRTTREHLAVAVALEVPTALVVTKADAIDSKQLQAVLEQLRELMAPVLDYCKDCSSGDVSSPADASAADGAAEFAGAFASDATGTPVVVGEAQAARLAAILSDLHSCTAAGTAASFQQVTFPVFTVSCVSGVGLPLLHAFLSKLRPVSTSARSQGVPSDWPSHSASATKPVVLDPGQHAQAEPPLLAEDQLQADHCEVPQQQQQHLATAGNSRLWLPFDAGLPTNTSSSDSVTTPVASTSSVVPAVIASTAAAMPAAVCHQAGHFQVVHTYDVQGVGWVVSGIAVAGTIEVGQSLLWGPTADGGFSPVSVSCIQRSHVPVRHVQPGQTATIALQAVGPDGQSLGSSKEALLSAAAAAQAAAEQQAAKEAAAACAAAPTITFGKPYPAAAAGRADAAAVPGNTRGDGGAGHSHAGEGTSSTPGPADRQTAAVAGSALDDSMLDLLADDLAAGLGLDDAESPITPCGVSELGSFDTMFGCDHDTDSSRGSSSGSSTSSSFSWPTGLVVCDSSINLATGATAGSVIAAQEPEVARSVSSRSNSTASIAQQQTASKSKAVHTLRPPAAAAAASGMLLGSSPTFRSKGAVLLDAAAAPCTYWEFEALLVLLGGHWPARGLLSGCWPPTEPEGTAGCRSPCQIPSTPPIGAGGKHEASANRCESLSDREQQSQQQGQKVNQSGAATFPRNTKCRSKRYDYAYVIHCNSIRQIARIVHMQEVREIDEAQPGSEQGLGSCNSSTSNSSESVTSHPEEFATSHQLSVVAPPQHSVSGRTYCGGLSASIQAAAALLQDRHQPFSSPTAGGASSGGASGSRGAEGVRRSRAGNSSDLGSVVSVRFRFTHRPEWMQVGARLIVRDRSDGHVAAAGFVTQLLEPHMRQQHVQQV